MIKRIYQEENKEMMKFLIETYVGYLKKTTHGKRAYEYSYKLRNNFDSSYYQDIIISEIDKLYYRNLLGGLYRENPVKSRNYEAVKSSKKWENVGNSYIIPALLLYRYSYI